MYDKLQFKQDYSYVLTYYNVVYYFKISYDACYIITDLFNINGKEFNGSWGIIDRATNMFILDLEYPDNWKIIDVYCNLLYNRKVIQ